MTNTARGNKELGFVESISRLIQAAENASVSRDELQSMLSQLHECSEELQRYAALNHESHKKIIESRKVISSLKDQLLAQEKLVNQLFGILSDYAKK